MDTKRIEDTARSLDSIRSAEFYKPNWAFVGFRTDFTAMTRQKVIRVTPLEKEHQTQMIKELNKAIKPILEKYEKIFKESLKQAANTV